MFAPAVGHILCMYRYIYIGWVILILISLISDNDYPKNVLTIRPV